MAETQPSSACVPGTTGPDAAPQHPEVLQAIRARDWFFHELMTKIMRGKSLRGMHVKDGREMRSPSEPIDLLCKRFDEAQDRVFTLE
jgi:hypothetical protein